MVKGACVVKEGMHGKGVCVWQGACITRGHAWLVHVWWEGACMAGETATAVDGMHLSGMHSCYE